MEKANSFIKDTLARYNDMSSLKRVGLILLSVIAAMLVGSLLIIIVGKNPVEAYYYMLIRPLTSISTIGEVSLYFTSLLIVGLGMCFTLSGKLSNLGGEGQFLFGAVGMTLIGATAIGHKLGVLSLPLGILVGIIFGGLWAAIAGWFKVKFNSSEIVITLMLNYIAEQIISYLIFYHFRTGAEPQSARVVATLPRLIDGSRINIGVIIALVLVVVYAIVIKKTRYGYNLRVLGGSKKAAQYSGINANKYYFWTIVISGCFCGLAGALQISGNTIRLMEGVAGDFGFSGIVVALLGSLNPIGVVISALFMAVLSAGSITMQVKTGIPVSFTGVLEALIVLFILMGMAISNASNKRKKVK